MYFVGESFEINVDTFQYLKSKCSILPRGVICRLCKKDRDQGQKWFGVIGTDPGAETSCVCVCTKRVCVSLKYQRCVL